MPADRDRQLIEAVRAKNVSQVRELLAAGANPNLKDGEATLLQMSEHDRDIRYALVGAGAWDNSLSTELVVALEYGVDIVSMMIERGADVNVQTYSGTPLSVAARDGQRELVELLVSAGADLDAESPLTCAVESGHYDIALRLLEAGAMPDTTSSLRSIPAIATASFQGATEVVQALLKAGISADTPIARMTLNQADVRKQAGETLGSLFKSLESMGGVLQDLLADRFAEDEEELDEEESRDRDEIEDINAADFGEEDFGEEDEDAAFHEALNVLQTLQSATSLEAVQSFNTSPLILAARGGHAATVAILLAAGANPHHKDGEGLTALDWATRNDHAEVLTTLKSHGIVDTPVSADEELLNAAIAGDLAGVKASLTKGAQVNARDARQKTRNKTALILAAQHGHLEVVRELFAAGADTDANDLSGEIPFLLAGSYANADSILQYGYQLGRTALMLAVREGHCEVVRFLVEAGVNLHATDGLGITALAIACEKGHLEIARLLVAAGADVNLSAKQDSPLSIAIENGYSEVAKFLIAHGADISGCDAEGRNLLMQAASRGALDLVQLLIEHGIDVNAVCDDGTALIAVLNHYNSERENPPVIDALLAAGADPNLGDDEAGNALTVAVYKSSLETIAKLIANGVDIEKRDREGRSALGLARLYGRRDVLNYLRAQAGDRAAALEIDLEIEEPAEEDRWGEEIATPDFFERSQQPQFQQAVTDLATICEDKAIAFDEIPGSFYINVRAKKRKEVDIERVQATFLERGAFVFVCDRGIDDLPHRLVILPTTDKYEAVAAMGTSGCNYDIGPGYVLAWLRTLEKEQPFILTAIRGDLLDGRFLSPIQDPEGLAERMYEFCPDIVEQGWETVAALAASLRTGDRLYFWWD